LLPYKAVFFAPEGSLHRVAENLRPTQMARLFYTKGNLGGSPFVIRRERSFTVCNDLRLPLEELWKRFAPYNRVEIRKAERLKGRVRITRNEQAALEDFLTVYNGFARRKDGVWPISGSLLKRYERFADRLVLYLDEQPAVVNLVLRDPDGGRVRGMYNASRRLNADQPKEARLLGHLNRLLHWHNMRLYKEQGFVLYDWGGITANRTDGRDKFKTSFGGDIIEEHTYLCAGWPRFGLALQRMFELLSARGRQKRSVASQPDV
jgi:lipid II:glycine glycyltransferase (peptidoglycan interpeptide bridge formation enzyme)